ncbi:MAG: aminotransferase class I/II-fold pyridoxal phosphate-dependent enzyme, partial [Clostridia bacterium]
IYDDYRHISIASLGDAIYAQTIVVNGLSKSYAMTGWRIGYAAGPASIIKLMGNYQSHATSNPNSIAQYAGVEALHNGEASIRTMREAFDARRIHMVERINAMPPFSCRMPHGAFYVMMNIAGILGKSFRGQTIPDAMTFSSLLLEHAHVAVVPGEAFEAPHHCRLSYAIGMADIDRGLDRLSAFLDELTGGTYAGI